MKPTTTTNREIINLLQTQSHNFNGRTVQGINARQLHQALGVGRDYSNWIKARIKQGRFMEETDYLVVQNSSIGSPKLASQKGGNNKEINEYILSVDMAKHLCLMEKSEVAHTIRQHFIEAEKKLQALNPEEYRLLIEKTQHRLNSISIHNELRDTIKRWTERNGKPKEKQAFYQMSEAKLVNSLVLGENQDSYKRKHGIQGNLREHFTAKQLSLAIYLETQNIALLECDMSYHERKQKLTLLAQRKRIGG